jgi:hypothetical protein
MKDKIHTLVFLGFTAVAALSLSGCFADNTTRTCANPLRLTWSIDDGVNNFSCPDKGAGWVRVTAGGVINDFSCDLFAGLTDDVPGGRYAIDVKLLTPSRTQTLSEANQVWDVPSCGGLDIGDVAFLVP